MSLLARSLLIGGVLLAAYYALIFGYALRSRAERAEHVAWRFPLDANSDLCADPLANGGVVCSNNGKVIVVGPDGKLSASYVAYEVAYVDRYGYQPAPFNGYQWIGGTKDSLTLVSVAKPPMDQLRIVAMENDGRIRWEHEVKPGLITGWITCSPESVFILYHKDRQQGNSCVVERFDLGGKLLYSRELKASVGHIAARDDNRLYLLDQSSNSILVLDAGGKQLWTVKDAVSMPLRPNFANEGMLYYLNRGGDLKSVDDEGKLRFNTNFVKHASSGSGQADGFWLRELVRDIGRESHGYGMNSRSLDKGRVADSDGIVFVIYQDKLFGVTDSGQLEWTRDLPSEALSLAADKQGNAYVALSAGGLAAYDREGNEKWRNTSVCDFSSLISIGEQGQIYVEADKQLICFKP